MNSLINSGNLRLASNFRYLDDILEHNNHANFLVHKTTTLMNQF